MPPKSTAVHGLTINAKGEIKSIKVSDGKKELTEQDLKTLLKKKTGPEPEEIGT